jgi:hypothetical protein
LINKNFIHLINKNFIAFFVGEGVPIAAQEGHETVTNQLIAPRCKVDPQTNGGCTWLKFMAEKRGQRSKFTFSDPCTTTGRTCGLQTWEAVAK